MAADLDLVATVRASLARDGDPERAAQQQAYMKSTLPFHGLAAPSLRATMRPLLATYAPGDRMSHEATVRELWDGATHREERYAAVALVRLPRLRGWLDPGGLPLLRHLVVTGAWWDLVDDVATHAVGQTLLAHPTATAPVVRDWATDDDLWLRRAAVVCQVLAGKRTDLDLLRDVVVATVDDPSPWLRKAIGWALRSCSRTDPDWVRAEVERLGPWLSGLSRREALKLVEKVV